MFLEASEDAPAKSRIVSSFASRTESFERCRSTRRGVCNRRRLIDRHRVTRFRRESRAAVRRVVRNE